MPEMFCQTLTQCNKQKNEGNHTLKNPLHHNINAFYWTVSKQCHFSKHFRILPERFSCTA